MNDWFAGDCAISAELFSTLTMSFKTPLVLLRRFKTPPARLTDARGLDRPSDPEPTAFNCWQTPRLIVPAKTLAGLFNVRIDVLFVTAYVAKISEFMLIVVV